MAWEKEKTMGMKPLERGVFGKMISCEEMGKVTPSTSAVCDVFSGGEEGGVTYHGIRRKGD